VNRFNRSISYKLFNFHGLSRASVRNSVTRSDRASVGVLGAVRRVRQCSWAQTWPRCRDCVNGAPRESCRVFVESELGRRCNSAVVGSWAWHTTELLGPGAILSCSCVDARLPDDLNCHLLGLRSGTMTKTAWLQWGRAPTECRNDRSFARGAKMSAWWAGPGYGSPSCGLDPSSSSLSSIHYLHSGYLNFHQPGTKEKSLNQQL
jgi:hypothetical protein